jgi:16S rRNA G966 N2-methylase RsmD
MGFMVQNGVNAPKLTVSKVGNFGASIDRDKKRIAADLFKIRHWEVKQGDYTEIENVEATWFIDPPYQFGGEYYVKGNKDISFSELGDWCKSRKGQILVCENTKADWLPFFPIGSLSGSKHKTTEAVWMNDLAQPALLQV